MQTYIKGSQAKTPQFFKMKQQQTPPSNVTEECTQATSEPIVLEPIELMPFVTIKRPSKILPVERATSKRDAFRMGAKHATGSSTFYGVIPKIKEALGILPATPSGPLVDAINVTRNEARHLNEQIIKMCDQFDCVMDDDELSLELKREAAQMALYFLETSYEKLKPVLTNLKMYTGLLKGNAKIGYGGTIVAGKQPRGEKHPYLVQRDREKEIEMSLLVNLMQDDTPIQFAKLRLADLDLSEQDYLIWKKNNAVHIEVELNRYRGLGGMTGTAIQCAIFSAINFTIAGITLNPVVFAAGAYGLVSGAVRVSKIGVRTRLENELIREHFRQLDAEVADECFKPKKHATLAKINTLDTFEMIHDATDKIVNTATIVSGMSLQIVINDNRPSNLCKKLISPSAPMAPPGMGYECVQTKTYTNRVP